jgi:hypothetical protein
MRISSGHIPPYNLPLVTAITTTCMRSSRFSYPPRRRRLQHFCVGTRLPSQIMKRAEFNQQISIKTQPGVERNNFVTLLQLAKLRLRASACMQCLSRGLAPMFRTISVLQHPQRHRREACQSICSLELNYRNSVTTED